MIRTTILSDIHGMQGVHKNVMQWNDYTLQLGDCGFDYTYMFQWDPLFHKILGGNHDNYPLLKQMPHDLGNFGMWRGIFVIRGAFSIDKDHRTEGMDWWQEEELSMIEANDAIEAYAAAKPDYVVTHDCPEQASCKMRRAGQRQITSRTGQLLGRMFEIHEPKVWVFGHWHVSKKFFVEGHRTDFVALHECETYKLEVPDGE